MKQLMQSVGLSSVILYKDAQQIGGLIPKSPDQTDREMDAQSGGRKPHSLTICVMVWLSAM